jgi:hypothetical protein
MDVLEKAKIRITNWIDHNDHHQKEYELFADQLEKEGKKESALHIMDMAALTAKNTGCLRSALEALGKE